MKKIVLAMAAVLSASAALVSCTNTEVFEEGAAEKAKVQEVEAKYKQAFVEHFGDVDPQQTWDFSQSNYVEQEAAKTRAGRPSNRYPQEEQIPVPTFSNIPFPTRVWNALQNAWNNVEPYADITTTDEKNQVIACAEDPTLNAVEWPYEFAQINLHPLYTYVSEKKTSETNFVGVIYNVKDHGHLKRTANSICFKTDKGQGWHSIVSEYCDFVTNYNELTYFNINSTNMEGQEGFQWFTANKVVEWKGLLGMIPVLKSTAATNLTYCKQFIVNGHTYVALDTDGDGIYTDLICWVEDMAPSKRYMVEDLGKVGDFDFNDIVFDVVPKTTTTTTVPFRTGIHNNNNDTQYECIIRAMGGTLDFTITVGNTSWTKSDKKNGFNVKTMYNTTGNYNASEVLARFDVDGWVPAENKVSVTVVGNEGTFVLPFPEEGEIPYIICTNIAKPWSKEKVDVQTIGWFGSVENNCSIDLDVDDLE